METKSVKIDTLTHYENNARRGNVEVLADSLRVHGQYRPIVVQKSTNSILAGNHLVEAAKTLGWENVDVVFVDVDDEAARKIVLVDNRSAELGEFDKEALIELLSELGSLDGTGYVLEDLDDLFVDIEEAENETMSEEDRFTVPLADDNVTERKSIAQLAEEYAGRTVRNIQLEYENKTFVWVVEKLAAARGSLGLENNSQLIVRLLEKELNESAP